MSIVAAEAAKDRGNAAFKAGDLPLALANYSTAIQLDPSSSVYLNNRALVHLKLKLYAKAEADATKAFNLDPSSAKALYRRGLARVGAGGKVEQARADFTEALKLGGGPEVKAELAKLATPPPLVTPTVTKKADSTPPPPRTAGPSAAQSRTDRLRAALAEPEQTPKPANTPKQPQTQTPIPPPPPHTSKQPPAPPSVPPTELMKEVSTRRLSPAGGASQIADANPFARMKEQRQTRLESRHAAKVSQTARPTPPTSTPAKLAVGATAPATAQFSLPTGDLSALSIAERELAASPAWQSIAANAPPSSASKQQPASTDPRMADTLPSVRGGAMTSGTGGATAPTTFAVFERRWLGARLGTPDRLELLRSLAASALPSVMGDSLTPDLLSAIVKVLASDTSTGSSGQGWKIELLRGLTGVRRFVMAVGFLEEAEKADLRAIFDEARKALAEDERAWEL